MKIKQIDDDELGFQLAPMIDITFLLVVFFMAAANLQTAAKVEIKMPKASAARAPQDPGGRGVVTIKEDGQIYVGAESADTAKLTALVRDGLHVNPNLKIQLRADKAVPFKKVREVMGLIAEAGVGDIIFAAYEN